MNYNLLNVSQLRTECKLLNIHKCQGSNYIRKQVLIDLLQDHDLNTGIVRLNIQTTNQLTPKTLILEDINPITDQRLTVYISVDYFKSQIENNNNDYIYLYFNNTHPRTIQEFKENKDRLLLWASENGHIEVVQVLLDDGANIEATNDFEYTSLTLASENGHSDVVQLLLNTGANIEAMDDNERTSLILASESGHIEVVHVLIDYGANLEAKDYDPGIPSLILAIQNRHLEVVQLLLDSGANVDTIDYIGRTPLMVAAEDGQIKAVHILLSSNADIEAFDDDDDTALTLATRFGHSEIEQVLKNHIVSRRI